MLLRGLKVSPLARTLLRWYRLRELAAAFDVLIVDVDEDGLCNPIEINDRLQLGPKGTFSEVEHYQIRAHTARLATQGAAWGASPAPGVGRGLAPR